jgi:hypothetical protein
MTTGHDTQNIDDLFQSQDTRPRKVQLIIDCDTKAVEEGEGYMLCADFLEEKEAQGYTFVYGLDGLPFDQHKTPDRQ